MTSTTPRRTNILSSYVSVREALGVLSTVVVFVWWSNSHFETKEDADKRETRWAVDLRSEIDAREHLATDIGLVRSDVSYIRGAIEATTKAKTK